MVLPKKFWASEAEIGNLDRSSTWNENGLSCTNVSIPVSKSYAVVCNNYITQIEKQAQENEVAGSGSFILVTLTIFIMVTIILFLGCYVRRLRKKLEEKEPPKKFDAEGYNPPDLDEATDLQSVDRLDA